MKTQWTATKGLFMGLCLFLVTLMTNAAPYFGAEFQFKQPDGSLVPVKVWGDEFYQRVESPDGYTLMRDADGWINYAVLSADGNSLVSSGVRYTGTVVSLPGIPKKLDINKSEIAKIRAEKSAGLHNGAPAQKNICAGSTFSLKRECERNRHPD